MAAAKAAGFFAPLPTWKLQRAQAHNYAARSLELCELQSFSSLMSRSPGKAMGHGLMALAFNIDPQVFSAYFCRSSIHIAADTGSDLTREVAIRLRSSIFLFPGRSKQYHDIHPRVT